MMMMVMSSSADPLARAGDGRGVFLLVGTRRGLFTLRSDPERERWRVSGPALEGREVYHAVFDPRDGDTAWAATRHDVWGAHVHRSDDRGERWRTLEAAPSHADERGLDAIWHLAPGPADSPDTLLAGIQPAGLFVSHDAGASWRPFPALDGHPTRDAWQPAGGGLALGSIAVDPRDTDRIYCAVSAGGVYRSDDGGESWTPRNRGTRADFLPDTRPDAGQCVHRLVLHPAHPDRLYQQNHCGAYRSDDRADHWTEITDGLPSDFGYALAVDPHDPDTAFVVPETSSHMRATVDGRLRVYRTTDAGASWTAMTEGLPQRHAYVSVLRAAMDTDTLDPCGVYLGTSGGHIFASRDRGESWELVAAFLPRILSVDATVL
ncbi:MAG: WD40/YVTN/BNR-like repeat-containing protein [Gemmatimonadota bacterium]